MSCRISLLVMSRRGRRAEKGKLVVKVMELGVLIVETTSFPHRRHRKPAISITKGASTLNGKRACNSRIELCKRQNPNAATGYTIFRHWYVTVYVNECNYPITWNIAEQARELDRARRVMNRRHPRFDDWKQRARPSYMRQPLHAGAVGFARDRLH